MADIDVIANPDVQALGRAVSRAGQLLRVLEEAGLSQKALQGPIDDQDGRLELVIWWEDRFNPKPGFASDIYTMAEAARILDGDFHGPDQARKFFGGRMSQKCFRDVAFDAEEVRTLKGTHVLVAVPRLSVMGIHAKAPQVFQSKDDPWFGASNQRRAFTDDKLEPDWYWVRKETVPGGTSTHWEAQRGMVQAPDFVPEANLAVYAYAVHKLTTGEQMFSRVWVRTNSVTSAGGRVSLDGDADGLRVDGYGDSAGSNIGVAEARKAN